jgi:hypothetical protein
MATFKFYLDQKCTVWYRTDFEIEADSEQDAINKATEMYLSGDVSNHPWHDLTDTIEPMPKEDNSGEPTEELFYNHNVIKTN